MIEQIESIVGLPAQRWRILPADDPKLTPGQQGLAVRLNGLGSLFYFNKVILGHNRLSPGLHGYMCRQLERDSLRLAMEIPRDHFKSTIASVSAPIWWALPFNDLDEEYMRALGYGDAWIAWMKRAHYSSTRTLIASETLDNAIKLGTRISAHYQNNAEFRYYYSEIIPKTTFDLKGSGKKKDKWNAKSMTHNRVDGVYQGEGTYNFIGVKGALQSTHYERQVIDDPVGEKAIKSDIVMTDTCEWIRKLAGAFDSDPNDPDKLADQLFIGNRWSERDVGAFLRREYSTSVQFETHSVMGGCCSVHKPDAPIFPEEFSKDKVSELRKIWGFYHFCTPYETPILMADWTEKKIGEVQVGDEVIGYEKDGSRWILKTSKVIAKHDIGIRPVMTGTTAAGRIFRCTPDHKWFTGRSDTHHNTYLSAKIGRELISVYTPSPEPSLIEQRLYDWLGGIFDGEGTCIGNPVISQSEICNPEVSAEIERVLRFLGIPYSVQRIASRIGHKSARMYVLNGGRSLKIRLLKRCWMAKRGRFISSLWKKTGRRVGEISASQKVVSLDLDSTEKEVFALTTTTGNYVAWGFASKNSCQYENNPVSPEAVRFKTNWLRHYSRVIYQPEQRVSIANSQQLGVNAHMMSAKEIEQDRAEAAGAIPERLRMAMRHETQNGEVIEDIRAGDLDRVAILDPTHSEGSGGRSRNAIVVLGYYNKPPAPRRIYLLDCWAGGNSFDEMIDKLLGVRVGSRGLAVKWKVHHIYLESEVAGQQGWYYLFRDKVRAMGVEASFGIRPLKTPRSANAKHDRIIGMEPIYENGLFWVCRTGADQFMEEYEQYPNGRFMDILDVIGYSPQTWAPGSRTSTRDFVKDELRRRAQVTQNLGNAGY